MQRHVNNSARNLFEHVNQNTELLPATKIDFGIVTSWQYGALLLAIHQGVVTLDDLDEAVGHGAKITLRCRRVCDSPYAGEVFHTVWDGVAGRLVAFEPLINAPVRERER
jgi:hypothetical protein